MAPGRRKFWGEKAVAGKVAPNLRQVPCNHKIETETEKVPHFYGKNRHCLEIGAKSSPEDHPREQRPKSGISVHTTETGNLY
jgi:hypothetical protein